MANHPVCLKAVAVQTLIVQKMVLTIPMTSELCIISLLQTSSECKTLNRADTSLAKARE